jgi:hypothetical protein
MKILQMVLPALVILAVITIGAVIVIKFANDVIIPTDKEDRDE